MSNLFDLLRKKATFNRVSRIRRNEYVLLARWGIVEELSSKI